MNNKSENIFDVQDNVVILTGGSGKLGSVYTNYLVNNGAIICNFDINKPSDELLNLSNENYSFFKTDLTKKEDISKSLNQVINQFGVPDALINNAALDSPPGSKENQNGAFEEYPELAWDKVMEVNLKSVFLCCQIIGAEMAKNGAGSIINISTFAIFEPDPSFPTSGIFRSGLAAFTKLYSDKYAKDNIRMNNILPGFIDSLPVKEEFLNRIPLKRYGKVSEISAVIEMLASDGGAYITGQNIRVDGGITRSV